MKKPNREVLRRAMYEILDNQLRDNDPPETRQTLYRLAVLGYAEEEARRLIAYVIAAEVYAVLKKKRTFDRASFIAALNRLPNVE